MRFAWTLVGIALGLTGCTAAKPEKAEDFASFATAALPDAANRAHLDFGSKVAIVGYEITPEGSVAPTDTIRLKLYWRVTSPLGPGWGLFSHIQDDSGRQLANFDREGAFRAALVEHQPAGLASLEPGKIYVDEQALDLSKVANLTPRITVVVGVWNAGMRLPVISGPTDGHDAAVVAHFSTGVERNRPAPQLKGAQR